MASTADRIRDIGPQPQAFDMERATKENQNYRSVAWSGRYLQVTLMSIPVGSDIGLEAHPETDQFLRLDAGRGRVQMGPAKDRLSFDKEVSDGWCVLVPAGTWHNIINIGATPIQVYTIYAPAHHKPAKASQNGAPLPLAGLRRRIDRLFEDFSEDFWPHRRGWLTRDLWGGGATATPAVDVAEKDNSFEITAELPGMEEKDIEVTLSNGGLLIRGEKQAEKEEKKKDYYLSERTYGSFERYFGLPDTVASDKISASFKNGVLTVTLPKTAEAKNGEKKIPVKAA